ncbi:hypothetical protein ABZV67_43125, partial [Streptomyces sp. NPDC005065]|uniref:hypothetical protein n=1 Tax=Streptomyces sp. NPDC005065 TaxID=3154461 RepID=UPI0033B63FDA
IPPAHPRPPTETSSQNDQQIIFRARRWIEAKTRPRTAQDPGALNVAQVLLVEMVKSEEMLSQTRVVVAVLHLVNPAAHLVAQGLDDGRRAPHHGLRGFINAMPLGSHRMGEVIQNVSVGLVDFGPAEGGVQKPRDGDVSMR